jgi:hypothetical protein
MNSRHDTQTLIFETTQEYGSLLDQMEHTTCELMGAIKEWDSDKVHELMGVRSSLCSKIGEKIHMLTSLDPVNQMGKGPSESPMYTRLEEAIQRIYARQRKMLSRQTEAEHAVASELNRRRPVLAEMNDRRGKQKAYRQTGGQARPPRFLDSKI